MFLQRTIRKKVEVKGVGIHTGKETTLTFHPAPANSGIFFIRNDLQNQPSVKTTADNVTATQMATTLGGSDFHVSTVEHCLSALTANRIDNIQIEVNGPEVPIVDGSADPFLQALLSAGFVDLDYPRKYGFINQHLQLGDDEKYAYVAPYNGLRITCTIDFDHPRIGYQKIDLDIDEHTFKNEIARARTFGFLKDVEYLRSKGLARGGSLDNAIILDEKKIMNPEGLRFDNEFVRHKVLDALGDLATLGFPLMGHIVLFKAGHDVMNQLVKKIQSTPSSYNLKELGSPTQLN